MSGSPGRHMAQPGSVWVPRAPRRVVWGRLQEAGALRPAAGPGVDFRPHTEAPSERTRDSGWSRTQGGAGPRPARRGPSGPWVPLSRRGRTTQGLQPRRGPPDGCQKGTLEADRPGARGHCGRNQWDGSEGGARAAGWPRPHPAWGRGPGRELSWRGGWKASW